MHVLELEENIKDLTELAGRYTTESESDKADRARQFLDDGLLTIEHCVSYRTNDIGHNFAVTEKGHAQLNIWRAERNRLMLMKYMQSVDTITLRDTLQDVVLDGPEISIQLKLEENEDVTS